MDLNAGQVDLDPTQRNCHESFPTICDPERESGAIVNQFDSRPKKHNRNGTQVRYFDKLHQFLFKRGSFSSLSRQEAHPEAIILGSTLLKPTKLIFDHARMADRMSAASTPLNGSTPAWHGSSTEEAPWAERASL